MKKLILLLLFFTGFLQAQTLQNPTYGKTTTNTLVVKTPATVTSVNFLPAFDADEITLSKINAVNLPLSTATINAINTADANSVKNSGNFTANRIPYTVSSKNLTDSSRLLWDNTNSVLNVNGNKPVISLKENLNSKTVEIMTNGSGSNTLVIQQNGGKKRLTIEGENGVGAGEPKLGIGNFSGSIPNESQLYVYGGDLGANIDARGSSSYDESNIDLEGNDWATTPNGLGFSYFGALRTGLPTIFGYSKTKLGQIRFGNVDTALITSINTTGVTPIRFGINTAEIANVSDKGFSYQSNFASANSSNPRWLIDKGYADGLIAGLGTGTNGYISFWNGTNTQTGDSNLFWDNTNKRFGIGLTTPLYKSDIRSSGYQARFSSADVYGDGAILIGSKGAADPNYYAELKYTNSTNKTELNAQSNELSFGTSPAGNAPVERVNISMTGVVKVNGLSGTGTRNVSADSNGNLVISSVDSRPYKVYTAYIVQSGTSAPNPTVLENSIGSIVWSRAAAGTWQATLSGAFTVNKTFCSFTFGNASGGSSFTSAFSLTSANVTSFTVYNSGVLTDNTAGFLEIRVYN